MSSPSAVLNGLLSRGLPLNEAIGYASNAGGESGYNPGINERAPVVPGSRGGFGLFQWTGPRRRQLEAFAQKRGAPVDDLDAQLDFLMWERANTEKSAAAAIQGAKDPYEATRLVSEKFLRPGIPHMDARLAEAEKFTGGNYLAELPQSRQSAPDQPNALARFAYNDTSVDPAAFISRAPAPVTDVFKNYRV